MFPHREVFGARKMIYVKDEDGLYTADPKKDPQATHIARISLQDLLNRDRDDSIVENPSCPTSMLSRSEACPSWIGD